MALGLLPLWDGAPVTLQRLFALPFRPVMWLIGVPWQETGGAAMLMATKTVLNEFVAYLDFSTLPPDSFQPRTRIVLTYALCGFAEFRQPGHHDRRDRRDDPGAAARNRRAGIALDPVRHAGDLHERRAGGTVDLTGEGENTCTGPIGVNATGR